MKGSWIVIDCELRRLPVDQLQPTDHHARTLKSPRFLSLLHRNTGRCRGRQRYGAACREQLRRQFILTEQRNASGKMPPAKVNSNDPLSRRKLTTVREKLVSGVQLGCWSIISKKNNKYRYVNWQQLHNPEIALDSTYVKLI